MSEESIQHAESKWMTELTNHLKGKYKGTWLPSHDLDHHRRVWKNACRICNYSGVHDEGFYEQLLLACFFHDLGMIYDTSHQHGKKSADLCRDFLEGREDWISFDLMPLLEAIEYHDDKDYTVTHDNNPVYVCLTLADDLDAFGARGVYRYIEIYLLRGLDLNVIPDMILSNAAIRYAKVESLLELLSLKPDLYHDKYSLLQKILDRDTYRESPETLVRWLFDKVINPQLDPLDFFMKCKDASENRRISEFLSAIRKEL
jgi:hypothetical protein